MRHAIFLADAIEALLRAPEDVLHSLTGAGDNDWEFWIPVPDRLRCPGLGALANTFRPLTIPGAAVSEFNETTSYLDIVRRAARTLPSGAIVIVTAQFSNEGTTDAGEQVLPLEEWLTLYAQDRSAGHPGPSHDPFIDLARQQLRIRHRLEERMLQVLGHGRYIMGKEIEELEEHLAGFIGVKHAIACGSGTDALLMGLLALEAGPGDAVFTTPFTFFATVETIALLGATPVMVDIDPLTLNIDPEKLEHAVADVMKRGELKPRGIVPVDLFGLPADYDAIRSIATRYDLWIIEDAAQAFGASYKGKRCPSFGTIGATSFFPAKPLGAYGDAGAVFTDDDELAEILRSIRIHGQGVDRYNNIRIGLNARMDTLQAAILLEKLHIYPEEIELRQAVAQTYLDYLRPLAERTGELQLPFIPEEYHSVWAQFSIRTPHFAAIQTALSKHGIPTARYYPVPMHLLDAMAYLGYHRGDLPQAEQAAADIISLPFHPYLTKERIARYCEIIASVFP